MKIDYLKPFTLWTFYTRNKLVFVILGINLGFCILAFMWHVIWQVQGIMLVLLVTFSIGIFVTWKSTKKYHKWRKEQQEQRFSKNLYNL